MKVDSNDIRPLNFSQLAMKRHFMNSIVYIVGLVVILFAIVSFFGLR